ncbi:MAG: division/cell wall cluster transcriptional repressor MraZ [Parcubacteria group bacterium]|nr:division/cell wall cluster transcriptional repressor MraZ [Parcubacteria group bacterium]
MFIGEYQHSLDTKGRISLPVKFRDDLALGAVLTKGLDGCLFLYTKEEWEKLAQKLMALPLNRGNTRAFSRLMLAGAFDVELDAQGRIIIPEYLRHFGMFDKKIIIAGLYNRLELWDFRRWEEYKQKTEKESNEIAEQLGELGV